MSPRLVCSWSRYSAERLMYEPPVASSPSLPLYELGVAVAGVLAAVRIRQACRRRNCVFWMMLMTPAMASVP